MLEIGSNRISFIRMQIEFESEIFSDFIC